MNIDTIQTLIRSVLKVGGGALLANGVASETDVEAIIGGVVALIGVVWGIWHRRKNAAAGQTASALSVVLLAGLVSGLLFAPVVLTGCKSVEKTTYRVTGVTAATVDKAMLGWGDYVAQQQLRGTPVPLSDELKVKKAFQQYQLALKAVTDAGLEYSTIKQSGSDAGLPAAQAALNSAAAILGASMSELVDLIASFGIPVQ